MSQQRLGSGFLWLTSQAIGRQILLFCLFVVLGRLLDPKDFGTVAIASSIVLLLQSLSSQAITAAVVQRQDLTDKLTSTAFTLNMLFCLTLAVCSVSAALLFSTAWPEEQTTATAIAVMSAMMPISALYEVHQALLSRQFRFDLIAKKTLAGQFVSSVIAVTLAFAGFGVWSLVTQYCLSILVELVIVRYYSSWRARFDFEPANIKQFLHFGGPLVAARVVSAVDIRSPELILGGFAGQAATGHFRIARALFDVIIALVGLPLRQMALPVLSPLKDDQAALRRQYLLLSSTAAWLFLAPFAVLGTWGPDLTVMLFGAKWAESGWIVQVFAWQGLAYALFNLYEPLLVSLARTGDVFRLRVIQAGLTIAGMLALSPFGSRSMVIGHTCGVLLSMPAMYYFIRAPLGLSYQMFFRAHAAPAAAVLVFIGTLLLVRSFMVTAPLLLAMAVSSVSACLIYSIMFLRFADPDLRRAIHAFFRKGSR